MVRRGRHDSQGGASGREGAHHPRGRGPRRLVPRRGSQLGGAAPPRGLLRDEPRDLGRRAGRALDHGGAGRARDVEARALADARLGWSYFPGRTTWTRVGGRPVAYAIDADGDRARSSDARVDPTRPTLLFAGESIAFGYGLPYDETFVHLVGAELGIQTVNLAVVGYGNDQAYRRLRDALPRFAHPL